MRKLLSVLLALALLTAGLMPAALADQLKPALVGRATYHVYGTNRIRLRSCAKGTAISGQFLCV